jgi:hypothetical protein
MLDDKFNPRFLFALQLARLASKAIKAAADEDLEIKPSAGIGFEFWRDNDESAQVLNGLRGFERKRVRQHFIEVWNR